MDSLTYARIYASSAFHFIVNLFKCGLLIYSERVCVCVCLKCLLHTHTFELIVCGISLTFTFIVLHNMNTCGLNHFETFGKGKSDQLYILASNSRECVAHRY